MSKSRIPASINTSKAVAFSLIWQFAMDGLEARIWQAPYLGVAKV
jgi:hypothetical protein